MIIVFTIENCAMSDNDAAKRAAAEAAVSLVEDGMCLGLGTGSTTAFALEAVGKRIRKENIHVRGVPTSVSAERLARKHGIPLISIDQLELETKDGGLDLALDGADEVSPELDLIKGRGGAHTREKVVASLARRFVVLIDASKRVDRLGTTAPVPVEVVPMAVQAVQYALACLGGDASVREGTRKDGPVVTDQGMWILDAWFGPIGDPGELSRAIAQIPGVLDHGLFVGLATDVFVGEDQGKVDRVTRKAA